MMIKNVNDANYVFIGNRIFVFEEMRRLGLKFSKVLAIKGSHLERQLPALGVEFSVIESKAQLLQVLSATEFDVLVSNGCPFILPVERFKDKPRLLINIHPSFLPDLRGADPVPGALLHQRDSGATCHVMDAGIDTGAILAQVKIPFTPELDAPLLYQLSFWAEKEAFLKAYNNGFKVVAAQAPSASDIYYSRKAADQVIDFKQDSAALIMNKIRAFGNRSQGVRFEFKGQAFKVFDVEYSTNPYLLARLNEYREGQVVFNVEDMLLVRKGDGFLKLKKVSGPLELIKVRDILCV